MKTAKDFYENVMLPNGLTCVIWAWIDCPLKEKYSLSCGGDEDFVILYTSSICDYYAVVEKLAISGYNDTNFGEYTLVVTCHA